MAARSTESFTIAGTGWGEAGYASAIRMGNATYTGPMALSASATLGSDSTGTVSGVISGASGSNLSFGGGYQPWVR